MCDQYEVNINMHVYVAGRQLKRQFNSSWRSRLTLKKKNLSTARSPKKVKRPKMLHFIWSACVCVCVCVCVIAYVWGLRVQTSHLVFIYIELIGGPKKRPLHYIDNNIQTVFHAWPIHSLFLPIYCRQPNGQTAITHAHTQHIHTSHKRTE